jgi:hypothetical protein
MNHVLSFILDVVLTVGIRISLDRGMGLTYSRPPYRCGLELSCYGVLW